MKEVGLGYIKIDKIQHFQVEKHKELSFPKNYPKEGLVKQYIY